MFVKWSDVGTYHIEKKRGNEDALVSITDGKNLAVALCDGVSTCEHAREGAKIACESLCRFFIKKSVKLMHYDNRTIAEKAVSHIMYDLKKQAEISGNTIESFSSTAACAVYDDEQKKLLCINIGDALIGGINENGFEAIINPQKGNNGCYVTTTKGVERAAKVAVVDAEKYSSVFICSDGMWKQFLKNGQLNPEIRECFNRGDYDLLINMLRDNRSFDDRSIVAMNINIYKGGDAS